jgi:hypothetical protein
VIPRGPGRDVAGVKALVCAMVSLQNCMRTVETVREIVANQVGISDHTVNLGH